MMHGGDGRAGGGVARQGGLDARVVLLGVSVLWLFLRSQVSKLTN